MPKQDPIRPTNDQARALAWSLINGGRFAALGTRDPETGAPLVTRIALGTDENNRPISLISELSHHTRALRADPICSLLIGEPEAKGDPLTHPRLTVQATADVLARDGDRHKRLRARWLATHPKSKLYIDFADFSFVHFTATCGYLNGGFGRAFVLTPEDLSQV